MFYIVSKAVQYFKSVLRYADEQPHRGTDRQIDKMADRQTERLLHRLRIYLYFL
jgi:hypothetical protein